MPQANPVDFAHRQVVDEDDLNDLLESTITLDDPVEGQVAVADSVLITENAVNLLNLLEPVVAENRLVKRRFSRVLSRLSGYR